MRVIIAGSRDIHDIGLLDDAIRASGFSISEVVSGTQRGVDALGEKWSLDFLKKSAKRFAPKGRLPAALRARNVETGKYADALIAIPGPSKSDQGNGTLHMIATMRAHGKPVFVPELEDKDVAV